MMMESIDKELQKENIKINTENIETENQTY